MDLEQQLKEEQAEKLVLDQLYVESLKQILQIRKQLVLKETELQKVKLYVEEIEKQLDDLKSKPSELKQVEEILVDLQKEA